MASAYFDLIDHELDTLSLYPEERSVSIIFDKERAKLVLMADVQVLAMLCMCLEAWDSTYTPADDDEQAGKEISFTSIITHLKSIWIVQDNNLETWPKHIQDFDPVSFGLEGKIQQSKLLIEQWCQILLRSMHIKCKYSTNHNRLEDFVYRVRHNLSNLLWYRAAEIVLFKNQIDILRDMLSFLSYSFSCVYGCTDSKELLEYENFVHAFSYNAACLTCMCWAKEANDETATAMNVLHFDMLHKIKPCAAHVTASYFSVLKSNNLQISDDSGQTLARFVDFFFEHTILEDVFLILRERLILLFTFLANAHEEDLIRNQIYALFHEDAYLLLRINEVKEDLSNKKMLLSDCMNKIDILTANIIQFNCRPSHSWNLLEAEKMSDIYFVFLQRELSSIQKHTESDQMQAKVNLYLMEIRYLRSLFFQCFEKWDDSDQETRLRLRLVVTSLQNIWGQEYDMGLLSGRLHAIHKRDITDQEHLLDLELKGKFQMSKKEINEWLVSLFHCSFHCTPSTSSKILMFMDSVFNNMSHLVSSRPCKNVAFKKQIEILEEKLLLLNDLLKLATNCSDSKNLEEFNMLAQVVANNAACLLYLYWAKEADDDIPAETNLMLSNMLQKIKPNTPDVARTYIKTLKAICLQPYDSILFEQTAMSFIDYFFEDLTTPWKNDFQILREEVMFFLTFVHHHHTSNVEEMVCSQLDVLFNDGVYDLLPFDDMKEDFSQKKVSLTDLMLNIGTENDKIRQLYCKFPDSFVSYFPKMIGQGFLDRLIHKLRNLMERMISDQKYVPCSEYKIKIKTIEDELLSLTCIFNQILELKDLNDALLEVVNMAYLAEHIIGLCFIFYHLMWHFIPYLFDVVDRIKTVRTMLENLEECDIINSRRLPHSAGLTLMSTPLLQQDQTSEIHGVLVVGFKEDEKIIRENIIGGTKSLDIVSIVGMGGLGKTTLAKKVYGLVKSHFNIFAFTCVSQNHDKRRLLLDILKRIVGVDAQTSCMTNDDLAHKLKKCLSRQKYFIVLDDVWDIKALYEIRSSFPDDGNGSRIMFTTRSLEVAKRGKITCNPHCLRFLSKDESWKLLQKKVFNNDNPPSNISSVAKVIADKCGGLPLAIVVIAGLLARTETSLWIEISKRVSSCLFDEGCMNILELSYKNLPEYLKPCLLYLGAFPEDSFYSARHVTLLWIDEGFIRVSKTKSLNDVAKEYLYELVERSLIIVDKIINDEICTFRVHDLIHDLCHKHCQDDNFFQLRHGTATSSFSALSIYKHYRISVQKPWDISVDAEPLLANTRSLLYFLPECDYSERMLPLRKFRFVQVLYLEGIELQQSDFTHVTSLIDLRHIKADVSRVQSIPSSISNLWNIQSLILTNRSDMEIDLPETLWRMKSLRHVKVHHGKLSFSDGYMLQLEKVVSFSKPRLYTGKDVEWLLKTLPAVKELGCILDYKFADYSEERVETFDFGSKLESLKLKCKRYKCPYLINFPSTLIKLTLEAFQQTWTAISAIAELQCLRILKLRQVSFPGRTWEMEDVAFPNLKYFELHCSNLQVWNANIDSFPCMEQLFLELAMLEELPPTFGEISSLKKITIQSSSQKLKSSARRVQEEQLDWGNKVELWMWYDIIA